jgi:hypothetical protein
VIDHKLIEAPNLKGQPAFADGGRKVGYGIRQGRELLWRTVELK